MIQSQTPPPDLARKVRDAVAQRRALDAPPSTTLRRLFHDEADGVAGLIIDLYSKYIRVDVKTPALAVDARSIADAVFAEMPGLKGACLIERPKGGGQRAKLSTLQGEVPAGLVVREQGMALCVRLLKPGAPLSGAFVDLREGRRLARENARGRPAMNLFAHAGAFGVAMAMGGASQVTHVDSAKSCAPWAALNLALNGLDPRRHRFIVDDAFKVLRRAAKRGPKFGVIAADPPTTAARKGGRYVVSDALVPLATDACTALASGGVLLLSTNDRRIAEDAVANAAREGAEQARRTVTECRSIPLPLDLMPNGHVVGDIPVRGVLLRVD